jgi:HSP20 family protein
MPSLARRHAVPARIPDLLDWLESPWPAMLPPGLARTFRVEDYTENGNYVIRAELPGLDPDSDVEVTAEPGTLTIHAERREETREGRHSEFRYGSLTRSVPLPEGADPGNITASYDQGILKVSVPVPGQAQPPARRIAISHPG